MKIFSYTSRDKDGRLRKGTVQAVDRMGAMREVKAMGGVPLAVTEARAGTGGAGPPAGRRVLLGASLLVPVILAALWLLRPAAPVPVDVAPPARPAHTANSGTGGVAQAAADVPPVQADGLPPADTPPAVAAEGGAIAATEERPVRGAQRRLADAIARGERVTPLFGRVSEGILAMYIEPGRGFIHHPLPDDFEEDLRAALAEDIIVTDTDTPDEERRKELVAWLKEDARRHIAGGGTALGYMALLREREARDAEVYAEAQRILGSLMADGGTEDALAAHRALNAELEAAGIAPLPLPGRIRRELKEKGIGYGQ